MNGRRLIPGILGVAAACLGGCSIIPELVNPSPELDEVAEEPAAKDGTPDKGVPRGIDEPLDPLEDENELPPPRVTGKDAD